MPKVITITAKAGSEGRLFGSVTSADVVDAVAAQAGIELDRRKLQLGEPDQDPRHAPVAVQLHPDVEFPVTVEVVAPLTGRPGGSSTGAHPQGVDAAACRPRLSPGDGPLINRSSTGDRRQSQALSTGSTHRPERRR